MKKPNFEAMTTDELRNYLLQHRDDDDALHAIVLRIEAEGKTVSSADEYIEVVKQKLQQNQQS